MVNECRVRDGAHEAVRKLIGRPLGPGDRLISGGIIDSLAVLKLISLLEGQLSITIPTETVQPDDFDTIDLIVETVERVGRPS